MLLHRAFRVGLLLDLKTFVRDRVFVVFASELAQHVAHLHGRVLRQHVLLDARKGLVKPPVLIRVDEVLSRVFR